jgi:O-antigen/teichoic acid export membrane protein
MAALRARSISAVFWGAGGTAVRMVVQIGAQIVLARLLGPGEYGLFAVGAIVVGFSGFFSDFGLAYALIQKREVSEEDIRFAFSWQLVVGVLISLLIALAAPVLAGFFGEMRAAPIIAALGSICFINAVTGVSLALLKRRLDFKTQQIGFIVSYAIGFIGVGIPMAIFGYGVWALVTAWISQALIFLAIAYAVTRHSVQPLLWYGEAVAQLLYGRTVIVTNVFNWAVANVDKVLVGRLLPSRDIGLYSTLYNLVYVPTASVLNVIQPVFFSASARVAEEADEVAARAKLAAVFTALVSAVCLYVLPMALIAAVLADQLVVLLYGPGWRDGAVVLAPVCIAMPFFLTWGLSTPMLWASGVPHAEFGSQWHIGLIWGLACWALALWGGIAAVAWGNVGLFSLRCFSTLHAVTVHAAVSWGALWRAARGGIGLSLLVGLSAELARYASAPLPLSMNLVLAAALSLAVYCLALCGLPQLVAPEVAELMRTVMSRLPAPVVRRLAWLYGA